MLDLTPHECRVLGVLVEKAHTTPGQYPLTLNAVTSGANQKSNRNPVLNLSEDDALHALDGLRSKSLSREVMLSGSRVEKHRHIARETLEVDTAELVVLAELLLRGPQTIGELRGRATRMHTLDSIEAVSTILDNLMSRDEPYVRKCAPAAGSRAPRYAQLFCPDLHPLDGGAIAASADMSGAAPAGTGGNAATADLVARVERLEQQVARLTAVLEDPGVPGG